MRQITRSCSGNAASAGLLTEPLFRPVSCQSHKRAEDYSPESRQAARNSRRNTSLRRTKLATANTPRDYSFTIEFKETVTLCLGD
jgi:hypothetical protein